MTKENSIATTNKDFLNTKPKNISFQERIQQETEKKNATEKALKEKELAEKKKELDEKLEYFETLRNKFSYDETKRKLRLIIEDPQIKILVENMAKEAGLKEAGLPIYENISDFSLNDLCSAKNEKNFSEKEFILKHVPQATLIFGWGKHWIDGGNDEQAGIIEGDYRYSCTFSIGIKIDNSESVVITDCFWTEKDGRVLGKWIKNDVVYNFDELFEKITSAYIEVLPKLKELAKQISIGDEKEKLRKEMAKYPVIYIKGLINRKKNLENGSLPNKIKSALGLINYEDYFNETELETLENIEYIKNLLGLE